MAAMQVLFSPIDYSSSAMNRDSDSSSTGDVSRMLKRPGSPLNPGDRDQNGRQKTTMRAHEGDSYYVMHAPPQRPSGYAPGPSGPHQTYEPGNSLNAPPSHHGDASLQQFHAYGPPNAVAPGAYPPMASSHPGGPLPGGQTKRPYRQRRKDPSCDACRERKVKCDATETASCTECKSRGVKCQFTKETNRRMSSIKQVQDLEKQLSAANRKIAELLEKNGAENATAPGPSSDSLSVSMPALGMTPRLRPQAPPVAENLAAVRNHLRNYGRGVFKPPPPYRPIGEPKPFAHPTLELPPMEVGGILLASYYQAIHRILPIVHWPQLLARYEQIKHQRDTTNISPVWASMLFAVFACGIMHTTDPEIRKTYSGETYMQYSRMLTDVFNDEFTIEHAISALLTSVFMVEINCKSAAWTWLGVAVRIAQDIGLHRESGPWPIVEGEMRRRVWWGIYVWDRLLSVELGRVLQIEDRDCDAAYPCALDDHFIQDNMVLPAQQANGSNQLLTTIPVVQMIPSLLRALQTPKVSPEALQMLDSYFNTCQETFPAECQIRCPKPLDPHDLSPMLHLQNLRIFLHRHNLSTHCSTEVRAAAVSACVAAAKDTVQLLRRIRQYQPQPREAKTWEDAIRASASTMICTHIWRCMLFLCFDRLFEEAIICMEVAKTIGDFRAVNVACGRNMYGFLMELDSRLRQGVDLIQDEIMLALVSGDCQGSTENSWVWNGSETGAALNSLSPRGSASPRSVASPGHSPMDRSSSTSSAQGKTHGSQELSDHEKADWHGWAHVISMVWHMKRDLEESEARNRGQSWRTNPPSTWTPLPQQQQQPSSQSLHPHLPSIQQQQLPSVSQLPSVQQLSSSQPLPPVLPTAAPSVSDSSRISIANII